MNPNQAMAYVDGDRGITHAVIYVGKSVSGRFMGLEWSLHDQRWRVTWWKWKDWKQMLEDDGYKKGGEANAAIRHCCTIDKPEGYKEPTGKWDAGYREYVEEQV